MYMSSDNRLKSPKTMMVFALCSQSFLNVIWLSNISTLSVADEWLFQKRIVCSKLDTCMLYMYVLKLLKKDEMRDIFLIK
jgi:predicted protein tyrosine phosphatase